jgi:hypothetical protein
MNPPTDPVLSTRFSFRDPMLFRARATLSGNELLLTGWHFGGRYSRLIPTDQIVHVDANGPRGLVIWLIDGEVVRLKVDQADTWKRALTLNPDPETG